jgi:hypothetical protein
MKRQEVSRWCPTQALECETYLDHEAMRASLSLRSSVSIPNGSPNTIPIFVSRFDRHLLKANLSQSSRLCPIVSHGKNFAILAGSVPPVKRFFRAIYPEIETWYYSPAGSPIRTQGRNKKC